MTMSASLTLLGEHLLACAVARQRQGVDLFGGFCQTAGFPLDYHHVLTLPAQKAGDVKAYLPCPYDDDVHVR